MFGPKSKKETSNLRSLHKQTNMPSQKWNPSRDQGTVIDPSSQSKIKSPPAINKLCKPLMTSKLLYSLQVLGIQEHGINKESLLKLLQ